MTRAPHLFGIVTLLAAVAGCTESAPSAPTWIDDVRPILAANCVRCHGLPAIAGAPGTFRLDKYGDTLLPDGTVVSGAAGVAFIIGFRAGDKGDMPPDYPRPDWQRDTLLNWNTTGVALGDRADNAPPELIVAEGATIDVPGSGSLPYEVTDADGDLVDGQLIARPTTGDDIVLSADLRSGRGVATYDTPVLPDGSYELLAVLTDDLVTVEVSFGSVSVAGNVARAADALGSPR